MSIAMATMVSLEQRPHVFIAYIERLNSAILGLDGIYLNQVSSFKKSEPPPSMQYYQ